MVRVNEQENNLQIVLTPNRSMSWRGNQYFILSLLVLSGTISLGFTLVGAWVILPFAGLEMLALSAALYYVSWKLNYREVINLQQDEVIIEKGYYNPKKTWRFKRADTTVTIEPEQHAWGVPVIRLQHKHELLVVGDFLSQIDNKALQDTLRDAGLRVRSHATTGTTKF